MACPPPAEANIESKSSAKSLSAWIEAPGKLCVRHPRARADNHSRIIVYFLPNVAQFARVNCLLLIWFRRFDFCF